MSVKRIENTCETQQIQTKPEVETTNQTNEPLPLVETDEIETTTTGMDNKTQIKLKEKKLKELETERETLRKKQNILYENSNTRKTEKTSISAGLITGGVFGIIGGIACKSIPAAIFYGVPTMAILGGVAMLGSYCLAKYRQNHPEKIKSSEEREVMTEINETQMRLDEINNIKTELEELYRNY